MKLKCWPTLVTVMWSDIMRPGWNMLQQILLVLLCPVSDLHVRNHQLEIVATYILMYKLEIVFISIY